MQTLLFFYGLAFWVMGILIFVMPKQRDLLGLSEDLWLLGVFGFLHGTHEWVDLLILRSSLVQTEVLTVFGALLLPLSFVPLWQFGMRILFRRTLSFPFLKYLWMIILAGWAGAYFFTHGFLVPGIVARYFICLPGTLLTATGLVYTLGKADEKEIPGIVRTGAIGAATFFIFYGILGGLVVPKAGFLPASWINDPNFLEATGIPVQFFRMLCAILLAVSFFALTGIYSFDEQGTRAIRRGGIKQRITLWLSGAIFSAILAVSLFGFFLVVQMREQTVGENLQSDAELLAVSISRDVTRQEEELRTFFKDPEWKRLLTNINASYESRSPQEREEHFKEMDRKWADPSAVGLENYLDRSMTSRLKNFVNTEERLAEVFLTDRYGGLVAASDRTTDFFQADEAWWQDTFNGGKGRETVRDVAWDDSSKTLGIDMAIPIKNEAGSLLGIAKQVMKIRAFFATLQSYRAGKTGYAVLVDGHGDIIFHPKFEPLTVKYYDEGMLQSLFRGTHSWSIFLDPHKRSEEMIVACAKVTSPFFEANGIHWYVFVDQSKKEIFAPLWRIGAVLGEVSFVLFLIFLWIGHFLGNRLARPVRELSRAAEEIQKGNWNYVLDVRSRDEIEDLADSFRFMVERLRQRQTALMKAKEEIETLSHGLEKKVEERTKDLSESQRATINILEDLSETNEDLKKYTEELTRTKEELEMQSWGLQKANDGIQALYQELGAKNLELKKINQLKDDFVSIVAHELRSPLGMVRESASLILDGLMGPISEKQKKYIGIIKQTGDRLIRISTDLLDLAKIEAGKIVVNFESIDFLSLVRQSCEGVALRAHQKGIALSEDFPSEKLKIGGDFDKLSQVMSNLLSNALKFTEKGSITVEVKDLGEEVRCAVRDTGLGISTENLPRLFSKFEQFGKRSASPETGSGLGLVISKSIIEAHGGRIWAESELGKGSSFIFTIPKDRRRSKSETISLSGKEHN
jgi:signal transduction histidine kinase/HAMP domain-containing protein